MANRKSSAGGQDRDRNPQVLFGMPGAGRHGMFETVPQTSKPAATVRRILGYLKEHTRTMIFVMVVIAAGTGVQMLFPYLQGWAIDHAISRADMPLLARVTILLGACALFFGGMTFGQQWIMIGISQRMIRNLRRDLYDGMMELSISYFDTHPHGDLMSRMTNDIDMISTVLTSAVPQLLASSLTILGISVAMLVINVRLALVALITVPLISLVSRVIGRRTRTVFKDQQRQLGLLNGLIEETVSGIRVLKLFRRERRALARFQDENDTLRRVVIRAQILASLMGPVMNMLRNVNFAVVAFAGGLFAVHGWATVGTIAIFLQYTRQFSAPINEIAQLYNSIQSAIAGAERIFEVMDEKPEIADDSQAMPVSVSQGRVELDRISFGYRPDQRVLDSVSFVAEPGQTVALVGPTGAGKTTIVNLLTRFYDVQEGAIKIDGVDIREVTVESLRKSIGIVLQDTFLFADSVRENIRYGRLSATDEEVEAAARLANAHHFIDRLPDGYDTSLSEEGSNLSQGQRQLLAIARAVLAVPTLLILDEATSSVDTRTEVHIQEAMRNLMRDRTSFVIAHRLNTIRDADVILVIHDGRITERGSHEELLSAGGAYARLYRSQFEQVR